MVKTSTGHNSLPSPATMWESRSFDEMFQFLRTGNNPRSHLISGGDTIYVHYGDIHVHRSPFLDCSIAPASRIDRSRVTAVPLASDGDLIMVDASEDYEGLGKSVELKNVGRRRIVAGLHTFLLRPNRRLLASGFAAYLQFIPQVRRAFIDLATGVSVYGISKSNLRSVEVSLPPLSEQSAIASALSDVDSLIESLEKLIAKKRAIKQGAMQELLTGKRRLRGFRSLWKDGTFGDLFQFLQTGNNPRSHLSLSGDTGYIHYGDIHTHSSPFLDCSSTTVSRIDRSRVRDLPLVADGDLLMVDASEDFEGLGKSFEVKNVGKQMVVGGLHTFLLRPDPRRLARGFAAYLQFMPRVRASLINLATGVSVYGVSKSNLRTIEVTLPPVDEQAAIAGVLVEMDEELASLDTQKAKLLRLKQGMMQALLTGRIRLIKD